MLADLMWEGHGVCRHYSGVVAAVVARTYAAQARNLR